MFYHRIFWIQKNFDRGLWGIGIVTVLWSISVYLVKWLMRSPVAYTWDISLPGGTCINISIFLVVSGTINSVLDFILQ